MPSQIEKFYVLGLVEVFLTNGHGVAINAEPIYRLLIDLFDSTQALRAVLSFNDDNIASWLQFSMCGKKYRELMQIMESKVSAAPVKELIGAIEEYKGPLDVMREIDEFRRKVAILQRILS